VNARRIVAALTAGLLLVLPPAAPLRAEGFRISAVEVRGAKRVSPDAILKAMATRAGDELDFAKVREDVKSIYRLGYFRDVTFDEEAPGDIG
jgi:outer membrane protein assembly factor BamA